MPTQYLITDNSIKNKEHQMIANEKSKTGIHCTWNFSERLSFIQNKNLEEKMILIANLC